MGPGRHICGCDRRIPHANAHSYSNSNCHSDGNSHSHSHGNSNSNSNGHSDGNGQPHRNRNIDAIDESYAYGYSYWHKYTETYSYSKGSSVHSASSDTVAETVAIFPGQHFRDRQRLTRGRSHQFGTGARARCRIVSISGRLTMSDRALARRPTK
jgi:hypothetical protein